MAFFRDAAEVDEYIGGMFRDAGTHPETGPKFREADMVMHVVYSDPDLELTVVFREDYQVVTGPSDIKPDLTLKMRADTADKFWRGDYNMTMGLAKGQVKAKGSVSKMLKLAPLTKPLFPVYREKIAKKDAEA